MSSWLNTWRYPVKKISNFGGEVEHLAHTERNDSTASSICSCSSILNLPFRYIKPTVGVRQLRLGKRNVQPLPSCSTIAFNWREFIHLVASKCAWPMKRTSSGAGRASGGTPKWSGGEWCSWMPVSTEPVASKFLEMTSAVLSDWLAFWGLRCVRGRPLFVSQPEVPSHSELLCPSLCSRFLAFALSTIVIDIELVVDYSWGVGIKQKKIERQYVRT